MKLSVLGCNGPYPAPGGACSGYLLNCNGKNILLDMGNGTLSNFQKITKLENIDMIILSHLHSDHISDMMVLRYALQVKAAKGEVVKPIRLYAPNSPKEDFDRLNIKDVFNLTPIFEDLKIDIDDLKISFKVMKHPVLSFAVSVQYNEKRFVYSGDTSWNEELIDFASAADALLVDSCLLSCEKKDANVAHLTAEECGIVASRARVKKLLLTHFWPENDKELYVKEAKKHFSESEAMNEMLTVQI